MGLWTLFGCGRNIYRHETVEQLPPAEYLARLKAVDNAYLLDIRTGGEYRRRHLEGARNINFLSFSFRKKIAALDSSRTVFIYCETAHRSPFVARRLWKEGFRNIVDLEGGHRALRRYEREGGNDE